nr:hypothetical protein OG409_21590 [Streptomyces sp. NBC_00974]
MWNIRERSGIGPSAVQERSQITPGTVQTGIRPRSGGWLDDPAHPNAVGHLRMTDRALKVMGLGGLDPL